MDELVIAFARTVDAIRAERALCEAGLSPLVMPLPGAIRAGCGICLRVKPGAADVAKRCLGGMTTDWYIRHVLPNGSRYEPYEGGNT